MNKYVIEAIGTMFLVLTIGLAVANAGDMAPLAIGAVLMVMIYAGGHISGAHYNPAVSLGIRSAGKLSGHQLIYYRISQIIGGSIAAGFVITLGAQGTSQLLTDSTVMIMLAEFLFTFGLVWTVLNVATTKASEGMSYYGLAIGCMVLVGAYAVGNISGGVFNPAVAIGNAIDGLLSWSQIWMHIVAQIAAGITAGGLFKFLKIN